MQSTISLTTLIEQFVFVLTGKSAVDFCGNFFQSLCNFSCVQVSLQSKCTEKFVLRRHATTVSNNLFFSYVVGTLPASSA